jgi:uncharacterized repeat protein (TIGR03806 family)
MKFRVIIICAAFPFSGWIFPGIISMTKTIGKKPEQFTGTALHASVPLMKLSEYGFFKGNISGQEPASGVMPYHLNTPLFSDYAEKLRFVKLPEGGKAVYNDTSVFIFPVGTSIIKTFYYPYDFRDPARGRRLIETRVLIHEANGWKALPYIWNTEQTDAFLDVAGETTKVNYVDEKGKKQSREYIVPNMNQCKGCHNKGEKMMPIGPTAWQLNGEHVYGSARENQLDHWNISGMLEGYPGRGSVPKGVVWDNAATGSLDERARIWLDINCAHCHRGDGPASSSGLLLDWLEKDPLKIGFEKTPVAAGRGSGSLKFDIVPGKPEESILLYRMKSNDPGVMMPELGRTIIQPEAISLVSAWIKEMRK